MYKQRMFQLLRLGLVILSAILIYLIIKYAIPYIYPFLLAIILSLFLNPIVTFLEKILKMPRGFAVFVILTCTISAIIGLLILLVSELIHGTAYLAEVIPDHFNTLIAVVEDFINEQLLPLYHDLASFFHTLSPGQQESVNESINHFIQEFALFGTNILNTLLLQISQTLASLPGSMTVLLFTIMAAFFMLKDWDSLVSTIKKTISQYALNTINKVWNHLRNAFYGFMKAQLILILITAFTLVIGLFILQIDYALTIALFAALADILPFIGTGIIFIPWILYLFLTGDYALTIALTTLYMVIVVQRQLLEPKIVSNNIGLNPLATLMALFIGIQIWGAFGLLIGPFLVLFGNAVYQTGLFHRVGSFIKGP